MSYFYKYLVFLQVITAVLRKKIKLVRVLILENDEMWGLKQLPRDHTYNFSRSNNLKNKVSRIIRIITQSCERWASHKIAIFWKINFTTFFDILIYFKNSKNTKFRSEQTEKKKVKDQVNWSSRSWAIVDNISKKTVSKIVLVKNLYTQK